MSSDTICTDDRTVLDRNEKNYWIACHIDLSRALVDVQRLEFLIGISPVNRSMITTMLSELGSNILKYASKGTLKVRLIENANFAEIEIAAIDKGPGIPDIELALKDFYSTGGTLGLGLSGVKRMSDSFKINSSSEGTSIVCRKLISGTPSRAKPSIQSPQPKLSVNPVIFSEYSPSGEITFDWGSFVRPCIGYAMTGDSLMLLSCPNQLLLAVIDATGHGQTASAIKQKVESIIRETKTFDLSLLMQTIHEQLSGTQGAAVGLMTLDRQDGHFAYVGVGNTRMAKLGKNPLRGLSRDGVLGSRLPRLVIQNDRLFAGDLVMLWTDGLPEQESAKFVQSIAFRSSASISKQWALRLGKLHDDVGCGVMKWQA